MDRFHTRMLRLDERIKPNLVNAMLASYPDPEIYFQDKKVSWQGICGAGSPEIIERTAKYLHDHNVALSPNFEINLALSFIPKGGRRDDMRVQPLLEAMEAWVIADSIDGSVMANMEGFEAFYWLLGLKEAKYSTEIEGTYSRKDLEPLKVYQIVANTIKKGVFWAETFQADLGRKNIPRKGQILYNCEHLLDLSPQHEKISRLYARATDTHRQPLLPF